MATRRLVCPCGNVWDHPLSEPVPDDVRQICPSCTLATTRFPDDSAGNWPRRIYRHGYHEPRSRRGLRSDAA